jgi:predicted nucleic acid-binding protein
MKKLKIYLDTSVISHLDAPDVPDREADTRRLWEEIKAGTFEVFISPVVVEELERCAEPKRSFLLEQLRPIQHTVLRATDAVAELTAQYLSTGILRQRSFDDCQHIAYACVYDCDMLISWNFKHLVNYKTISGVKSVNATAGYKEMPIYSPTILIEGGYE